MPDQATFTEHARAALHDAEREAHEANHSYVGQEHVLLALTRVPDNLAVRVLAELGVDLERLRSTVVTLVPRTMVPPTLVELPSTPRLREAMRLAADEAEGFNHAVVGTDHLLLGVLREHTGIGATALDLHGVTLRAARDRTLSLRAAGESES